MEDLKLLLDAADLSQESYDPTINKEVGKTIIEGDFPVLINKQGNTLFIAFRGTRASLYKPLESIKNMIINCSSSDFLGENTALSEFPTFNKYLSVDALKLTGHAGYMQQLNEYYTLIIDEIELYRGLITVLCGGSNRNLQVFQGKVFLVFLQSYIAKGKINPVKEIGVLLIFRHFEKFLFDGL